MLTRRRIEMWFEIATLRRAEDHQDIIEDLVGSCVGMMPDYAAAEKFLYEKLLVVRQYETTGKRISNLRGFIRNVIEKDWKGEVS